jgi:uncharacterized membrane protein YgcG
VKQLQTAREQNTLFAGLFGISIGGLILIQAILVFVLRKAKNEIVEQNIEWNPQSLRSRGIQKIKDHEMVAFPYIMKNIEDRHLKVLEVNKKKKKTKGFFDDEESQQKTEFSFDDSIDEMDYDIIDADDGDEAERDAALQNDKFEARINNSGYNDDRGRSGRS